MSGCTDKRFEQMLYAYELGILSEDDRKALELHLLDCPHCNEKAVKFEQTALLLRNDDDIHRALEDLAEMEAQEDQSKAEVPKRSVRSNVLRIGLATAAILVLLLWQPWKITPDLSNDLHAASNRLVVMDFDNLSSDLLNDHLGQIVSNLLITDLSESHYLQVLSSQRTHDLIRQLDSGPDRSEESGIALEVANMAQAQWVLLGSIIRDERQTVLTSQLIDVTTGVVVTSERIESPAEQPIFSLVDSLTITVKQGMILPSGALQEVDPMVADISTHSPEAYRLYLEGVEHFSRFYWAEATASFEAALQHDTTFAMLYYYLARLKRDRGLMDKAVQYYDNASRKERLFIRTQEALWSDNRHLAIQILQEAVHHYPDEKEAYLLLGVNLYHVGRPQEAITALTKATVLDPDYKGAYNQMAYIYEYQGVFDKALLMLDKYIELAPDEANPYDSKGHICAKNGRLDMSIDAYERALAIKPDFTSSLMYLGYMYMYRGDYRKSDSCLRAFASFPSKGLQSAGRMYLPYIPQYQGRWQEALDMLDSVIAIDVQDSANKDVDMKYLLKSMIFAELHEYDQALIELGKSLKTRSIGRQLGRRLQRERDVSLLAQCGQMDYAQSLADSIKSDLEIVEYHMYPWWDAQGAIEWYRGNADSAIVLLRKALDASPHFEQRYLLARAYLEAGQTDLAIEEFVALQTLYDSPRAFYGIKSVKSHYYLGRAYEASGRLDEAAIQYREFLRIWESADAGTELIDEARVHLTEIEDRS